MKFLLFDLFVVASFAVAVRRFLGRRSRPALECQGGDDSANRTCVMEQQRQPADPTDGAAAAGVGESETHHQTAASKVMPVSNTPPSPENELGPRATTAQYPSDEDDKLNYIQVGSAVELYGDTSRFAMPATVAGYDESSGKYSLHDVANDLVLTEISPEFVHPYQVYEVGTEAPCIIGGKHKMEMVPCAVLSSRSVERAGSLHIQYQVSFTGMKVEPSGTRLPYFRVTRIHSKE